VSNDDVPDRPGGASALARELDVQRHAVVGTVVGVAVAVAVYAVRVFELLGPAPDGGGPALFLTLAFVLAFGVAVLVTFLLTARAAVRMAREL
jgi:hypothetical protein